MDGTRHINHMQANLCIYLSGEIHSEWRKKLFAACRDLPVRLLTPETDHQTSDHQGALIMGPERDPIATIVHTQTNDYLGAKLNRGLRTLQLDQADLMICYFSQEGSLRQWNTAMEAGLAIERGLPLIVVRHPSLSHSLKEIEEQAFSVCDKFEKVAQTLQYVMR